MTIISTRYKWSAKSRQYPTSTEVMARKFGMWHITDFYGA